MTKQIDEIIAQYHCRWQHSPDDLPNAAPNNLPATQIHLHLVNLDNLSQSTINHWAVEQDIERINGITHSKNKTRYLGGRIGLRQLLCQYSRLDNKQLAFDHESRGKPVLKNKLTNGQLHFSYTLSKNYALYAFAWNRALGIDIELFSRKINPELMAKRALNQSEFALWSSLPKTLKHQAMLFFWTRKEAYGKLLGVGIRYFMNQVQLLKNFDKAQWTSPVSGLFDNRHTLQNNQLYGFQPKLPIAGTACVMCDGKTPYTVKSDQSAFNQIRLSAYCGALN